MHTSDKRVLRMVGLERSRGALRCLWEALRRREELGLALRAAGEF